jgi:hypothetical protein
MYQHPLLKNQNKFSTQIELLYDAYHIVSLINDLVPLKSSKIHQKLKA